MNWTCSFDVGDVSPHPGQIAILDLNLGALPEAHGGLPASEEPRNLINQNKVETKERERAREEREKGFWFLTVEGTSSSTQNFYNFIHTRIDLKKTSNTRID